MIPVILVRDEEGAQSAVSRRRSRNKRSGRRGGGEGGGGQRSLMELCALMPAIFVHNARD